MIKRATVAGRHNFDPANPSVILEQASDRSRALAPICRPHASHGHLCSSRRLGACACPTAVVGGRPLSTCTPSTTARKQHRTTRRRFRSI